MPKSREKERLKNRALTEVARALSPPEKKQFCAIARIGTRPRQLICFAKSELGAKRIAGRFYREMYSDRTVRIVSVTEI